MSPAYIPELPTGEGEMNPILFEPQNSEGLSLYEQETSDPYKEQIPFDLPKTVEKPQEDSALARYLREEKEREGQIELAKQEQERRQQEYMSTLSPFDLSAAGIINKSDVVSRGINEQFQKDFGWLGGQQYPGWQTFKKANYPDYESFQPEQQVQAFDYWQNNAVKFYSGYGNADINEVSKKIEDVLLANEDIRNAETQSIINRRKASGYNPPGIGTGEWQSGNIGFDSTRANIFAANSLDEAKKAYDALNRLKANQIVDENGNLNQAGWDEYNRLMQGEENDLIQAQNDLNLLSKFGENKPEGIRKALSAAKDFSRISQLAMTNADPIVSETLSGQRKIADPITGTQTTVPLSGFDVAKNILLNPFDFTSFTVGMSIAQQADLLDETLQAGVVGIGTGGIGASVLSANAAGNQEAALVASDLFQQTMRDNGLDPYNLDDWRKAYDGGIVEKAIRDGERSGQLKGQTTSAVETALDTLIGIGLKRIPVLGSTATGLKGIAKRFAVSAPLSMVSAGGGELAGQAAAFDKVNWNDVISEAMLDPLGQLGMQTPAEISKYASNKIFGKKAETPIAPETEAAPAPEAATEIPYREESEVETDLENKVRNVKAAGTTQEGTGPTTPPTQENVTEEDVGDGTVTGTGQQAVARSARESAEAILAAKGLTKDAYESAQAILDAEDQYSSQSSVELAKNLIKNIAKDEADTQSSAGAVALNQKLRREEFYSNLRPQVKPIFEVPQTRAEASANFLSEELARLDEIRQKDESLELLKQQLSEEAEAARIKAEEERKQRESTPAGQSAAFLDQTLTEQERLRQSPAGRQALVSDLRDLETNDPILTSRELDQLEFLRVLSPKERAQYVLLSAKRAVGQSKTAFNATLASRLIRRTQIDDRIRQSFGGMQALRQKLEEDSFLATSDTEVLGDKSKGKVRTAQESFENEANPNEQFRQAFTPKSIDDLIGLSRQLETEPYVAPESDIPANEFSSLLQEEVNTLPDKAKSKWTPEVFAAANEYYNTLNEDVLAGLEKPQRNRVISLYYGTIEERDAQAKGMSVEQAYNKRRNQGGFLDIPALGQGVAEAAATAWTKAKDFAAWSAEMVENFGNRITPYLRDLWNRLNSLIRNVGEFLTYTPNARARQRGSVDLRQGGEIQLEQDKDYLAAVESGDMETAQRIVDLLQGETRIRLTPEEKNFAQWMIDGPMGDADSISEVLERNVSSDELPKIDGDYLVLSSGEFVRDAEYRVGTQIEDMIEDALSDASITKAEAAKQRRAARSLTAKLSSALQESVARDEQGNIIPPSQRFLNKVEGNPNLGQNQQRTSLIRKTEAFFGGKIPNNVTFVNDRSEGNRFVARINATLTGQADIEINYAFADDSNINSALYEEIGHFASNRGMLTDFYNSLTPTEKADIDAAVSMYGKSEARMAETSVAALQAEERNAKSFAAIASRNKDLWTRIKNLVNKILSKIGIVSANTDNQVADIFLRAMNAYKNQRENNPDFSNRRITFGKTSFYSKPTARQEIDKAMDKIKESKDSPIRSLFNSINLSNLSKEKRNELQDRMKAYADATKAIIRGTEILNPEESKQRFDDLIQYLSDFKKTAWEEQFKKLQEKYSSSLKDKTADEFTSAKAVIAYVADLDNADSKKIIKDQKKKEDKKREATEKKDENEGAQVTLALEAQSNINEILNTAPYKEMSPDNKIWTMEAMEYLETLDPTQQTQRQNEALVAIINSAIEGNIIGFGKYTAARRIQMFLADLNAYIKDNGGKIPWYTAAKTRRIRRSVESFVSSEKTSQFFKKETIERMIFSHPELRDMWIKNLGNYFEKVQTANSSLQNELDKKLQASFEKHGLKEKTFAGNVKDKQLFSDKTRKSKARMMVAAMITQWTDGSNDPIGEINKAISDVFTGINNEIKIQAFSGARGVSNLDSFNSLINPLIRDGFLIREGNTFEVQATPEVWNEAVLNALQENERNALIEIRNTASLLQDRLKFTKEFWYGEEFEAVVNYVPKQAYNTSPDVKEESTPELNEGSFTPLPENPSLRRQGSVLFARQGLGKDQYYTLDIERAATKAIKSAAYEVTTAPERIMMHKAFNSDELLPYFGNEDNSSKSRRNTMRETLKAVHKAEMHIGTAPKRATSTEGVLLSKAGEMFTTLIGAQILGKVKNIASQYLSPIAGSTVIAGQDIFNGMVQLNTNDEWKADNGAAIKALYAIGFPDLEHRSEIIDFFYDVSSNTDLVKDIAKISLNENLTEEQKKEVIFAKVTAALDAGINVNKYISQMVNTKPDAWAAKHVFPGLLINRLKKAGVINKADEFVPAVMNDPRTEDALSKAKQDMSTAFGNANRYSLRPEFFVDRSKNSFIRNTLFSVAQTATSMAGDVIVAAKDASYFNSADKYASQIRKEGAKRLSAIALQTYIFAFISKVVTLQVLKYGALLFGKAEGLDEEEEQNLRNRIAINQELGMQDISQRAMSDMISNTMGFIGTNSATRFFSNIASKKAIEKLLYSDYQEKKKELEDKIKKEKNPSKKTDLQFQLELIKKGKQKLSIVFDDPSFGPTVDYFLNTLGSIDDPTQADFDALAEEYYKRGGLEKKPERNEALRYLGKFAGYAIPDIYAARQEAYKARKEVADKRKQRLESEEQKSKKNIDKINIPLISYP